MTDSLVATVALPAPYYIAKSNLCLNEKGESVGNGFFANLDFNAGEQVTSLKRALIGSLDAERLLDTCANCYVWTDGSSTGTRLYVPLGTKVQKCAGCQRFRYCSKVRTSIRIANTIILRRYRHVKRKRGTAVISMNAKYSSRWLTGSCLKPSLRVWSF